MAIISRFVLHTAITRRSCSCVGRGSRSVEAQSQIGHFKSRNKGSKSFNSPAVKERLLRLGAPASGAARTDWLFVGAPCDRGSGSIPETEGRWPGPALPSQHCTDVWVSNEYTPVQRQERQSLWRLPASGAAAKLPAHVWRKAQCSDEDEQKAAGGSRPSLMVERCRAGPGQCV